jgi:hypothetical protein
MHRHPASSYGRPAAVVSVENGSCTSARLTIGVAGSPGARHGGGRRSSAARAGGGDRRGGREGAGAIPNATGDGASGEYRTHLATVVEARSRGLRAA